MKGMSIMRQSWSVRSWLIITWLGIFCVLLYGCASNGDSSEPAVSEPTDIYIYAASGGTPEWFEDTYGKYFSEQFPHITFKVAFAGQITMKDYIASGESLDIIKGAYSTFIPNVLEADLQYDISDLIKAYDINLDDYDPAVIALQRQLADGKMYGLPAYMGTSGLYYNKDIFDKFSVDYPTDGLTWDDVYELAVKLTRNDGEQQYYGFANDNLNYIQANQLSLDLVDPNTFTANFESEPWKKIIATLSRFMTITDINLEEATVAAFNTKGTVAMATNYTGCCGFTPGDAVTNWDVVRIPDFPDLPNVGPQVFPNFWSLSAISQNKETAFEVISWVAGRQFQTSLNKRGLATVLNDPAMREDYGSDLPKYDGKNVAALFPKPHADSSNITIYQPIAAAELNRALIEIADGKDINTALREAVEEANRQIKAAQGGD